MNTRKMEIQASVRFKHSNKNFKIWLGVALCCFLSLSLMARTRVVSSLADSGPRTLRQALAVANPGDTIRVAARGTIYLQSGPLVIDKDIEIIGPGSDRLRIDGLKTTPQMGTPIFLVTSNVSAIIFDLTLTNAYNAVFSPEGSGGAVRNLGDLTLVRCVVTASNSEFGNGGGIYSEGNLALFQCSISNNSAVFGGGIADLGNLMIIDSSTINGNQSRDVNGSGGGGIFQSGAGTGFLTNVTISGNTAFQGNGGGILGSSLFLENCTVVSNAAVSFSQTSFGEGGGIYGAVEMRNTIVAGNTASRFVGAVTLNIGPDVRGEIISQGWNLIQNPADAIITSNLTGNLIGVDPELGPLQDNGGPTLTHALLPGSPAIDAASPFNFPPRDQRGVVRPQDGNGDGIKRADIGSFEKQATKGNKNNK